jgi:hypothetical protein
LASTIDLGGAAGNRVKPPAGVIEKSRATRPGFLADRDVMPSGLAKAL